MYFNIKLDAWLRAWTYSFNDLVDSFLKLQALLPVIKSS